MVEIRFNPHPSYDDVHMKSQTIQLVIEGPKKQLWATPNPSRKLSH